jgi:hypothetical protein
MCLWERHKWDINLSSGTDFFFVANVYCLLFSLNLTPKMQKCTFFCHIQIDCLMEFWSCRVRSKSPLLRAYIRYTFSYLCWQQSMCATAVPLSFLVSCRWHWKFPTRILPCAFGFLILPFMLSCHTMHSTQKDQSFFPWFYLLSFDHEHRDFLHKLWEESVSRLVVGSELLFH